MLIRLSFLIGVVLVRLSVGLFVAGLGIVGLLRFPCIVFRSRCFLFLFTVVVAFTFVKACQTFLFDQIDGFMCHVACIRQTFRLFTPFVHVDDFECIACRDGYGIGHEILVGGVGGNG